MTNLLPVPAAATPQGVRAPAVAVDPAALGEVAHQLQQRATALRCGTPALRSAWQQAAAALVSERTGTVLIGAWPGSEAALEACAQSVEALIRTLRGSADRYAGAETAAVPGMLAVERARAWIP